MAGARVSAASKRQRCITDSVCFAEIVAASMCVAEMAYHILLYEELEGKEAKPAPLFVDNQAATLIAKDPVTANNMKHVARRHFYVREMQELGLVRICWWHGKGNEADALTKALPKARHRSLVKNFFNLDRGLMREQEEAVREAYRDPPEDVQPGGSGV